MAGLFSLLGLGKKDSSSGVAVVNPASKVPTSDEKNALSSFNKRYSQLQTSVSGYKTYTSHSRDPSGELNARTRKILEDYAGSDLIGAIMESLGSIAVLHSRFEESEKFVNSGQGPHLKRFDSRKDETLRTITMLNGIALLATKTLNSDAKKSIENVYKAARSTSRNAIDEEIVIKLLVAYVQTAEEAKHFFDELCKRRETAKLATSVKRSDLPFTDN